MTPTCTCSHIITPDLALPPECCKVLYRIWTLKCMARLMQLEKRVEYGVTKLAPLHFNAIRSEQCLL